MKILIIGGCGFVGSNLALYFKDLGHTVTVMDNLVRRGSEFNMQEIVQHGIKYIHGDIRCKEDFVQLGIQDIVLECSAQPSATDGYDNPEFDFTNNTVGLYNVLEYARKYAHGLIFWSTNKVYSGDKINALPVIEKETRYEWADKEYKGINENFSIDGGQHSIYGMSKAMSDLAVQEYHDAFGLSVIVNRFSCLAGPRQFGKCAQGWVAWFVIAAMFKLPLNIIGWKGKQVRDVLYIDDVCSLIASQIMSIDNVAGKVYTVGGGKKNAVSIVEMINIINNTVDSNLILNRVVGPRKADHCVYISDISSVKNDFDWEPRINIESGIINIKHWTEENYEKIRWLYA
jgi:CDP-paratose 2-epimerase